METPPSPPRREPVRLDAWVAASQPSLGPARRNILIVVAGLTADGSWVPSSQIKEHFGAQRQPVNRHLRALEAEGLVLLENRGRGLPLYVRVSATGRRTAGLRSPQRPAEAMPEAAELLEPSGAPLPSMVAAPEPAMPGRGERFARTLYAALSPYLRGLGYQDFRRLLLQTLAEALGRVQAAPLAPPLPPPPVWEEAPAPQAPLVSLAPAVQVLPAAPTPPELSSAEEALEERLNVSCHPERRDQPWWERTRDLSTLWDQVARWRLGSLGTTFTSFGPRWRHPEWPNFNRARRQADARGARYLEWVQAQYDRVSGPVAPRDLHGEEALAAWHRRVSSQGGMPGPASLGPPPYTLQSFNPQNPDHAAYAEELLGQITSLAYRVYGQDHEGPIRLLTQAVSGGNLPEAALGLRPQWRDRVLAALGRQAAQQTAQPLAQPTVPAPAAQPVAPAPSRPSAPVLVSHPPKVSSRQSLII